MKSERIKNYERIESRIRNLNLQIRESESEIRKCFKLRQWEEMNNQKLHLRNLKQERSDLLAELSKYQIEI